MVIPSARSKVQKLINISKKIQIAANQNNLAEAAKLLRLGAQTVKELIPLLANLPKVQKLYKEVYPKNVKLNQQIAAKKAGFDQIAAFLKFIVNGLRKALS